ncbi:hypothetical protein WJX75_008379 [Coccomyxa subellipsoidea]|uniref:tRNA (adenine(58)-N(1))-methyltransferase non-catalytic subunit TRM6 n=1 Tax=Coccomyxa subellipsoidea TaxID=248742 RepID=A0ABR2YYW3_9CHLO
MGSCVIREGDNAILEFNNSFKTFVSIKRGSKVKIGKALCSLEPLIGQYYGIQFALAADGQTLEFKRPKTERDDGAPKDEWDANGTMDKNNSELLDRGDAHQNLKPEDIEAMRAAGMGGEAIVEALLANSETYESKTHFAQAKYRKRKAEKYMAQATLVRPTARALADAYFARSPQKIQNLRADSLALLLSLANIGAHAGVLVVETCSGLVTGAVAERLGGSGLVVSGFTGLKPPSLDIVRQFNFPASSKAGMPLALLRKVLPLLAPSGAFAIFANCLQPLAECMLALQVSKEAVALQLQESWWREHQVLPGRTHPEMMVSATGGYILTGYKVIRQA